MQKLKRTLRRHDSSLISAGTGSALSDLSELQAQLAATAARSPVRAAALVTTARPGGALPHTTIPSGATNLAVRDAPLLLPRTEPAARQGIAAAAAAAAAAVPAYEPQRPAHGYDAYEAYSQPAEATAPQPRSLPPHLASRLASGGRVAAVPASPIPVAMPTFVPAGRGLMAALTGGGQVAPGGAAAGSSPALAKQQGSAARPQVGQPLNSMSLAAHTAAAQAAAAGL